MTNEELINNIVCRDCISSTGIEECQSSNKEWCFSYRNSLMVAKEKDNQYLSTEFILKVLKINSNITDRSCLNTVAKAIIIQLKEEIV